MDALRAEDADIQEFTISELNSAISALKRKGAAGPDNTPNPFLKALGTLGRTELFAIFNQSLALAQCPQAWRNAIIVAILKRGKPASDIASYRPISLTSCLVKLLERMVANRLYALAETNGWFHKVQADFRKGRSTEDQII